MSFSATSINRRRWKTQVEVQREKIIIPKCCFVEQWWWDSHYQQLSSGISGRLFHHTDLNFEAEGKKHNWIKTNNENTKNVKDNTSFQSKALFSSSGCFWQRCSNPPMSAINKQLVYHWAVSSKETKQMGQKISICYYFGWVVLLNLPDV